jgi:replicative DNA helicase
MEQIQSSIITERRVLGIILCDVTDVTAVMAELDQDHFTQSRSAIFEACRINHEAGNPINLVTVGKTLTERKQSEHLFEMTSCTDGIYNAHKWKFYVELLNQEKHQRQLDVIKSDLVRDFDIERAFNRLQELQAAQSARTTFVAHDLLMDFMVNLDAQISGRIKQEVVQTRLRPLDRIITGFAPGELIYLGGRPGMGKTLLAMQIAMNQANQGHVVLFVTIEMSTQQLMARMTSNLAEIDGAAFLDPQERMDKETWTQMSIAIDQIKNSPLLISDMPEGTLAKIDTEIKRLKMKKIPIKGVFIDYLQLMQPMPDDRNKAKTEQVTNLSKAIKAMVRRNEIYGVVVCSLSRNTEQRGDRRPMLSDLRESGQLEFDADKVIFAHRPSEYMTGEARKNEANHMEVIVRKNRNGSQGTAHLKAALEYSKVTEYGPNESPSCH